MTNYKYLGQPIAKENRTKEDSIRNKSRMECFWTVQGEREREMDFFIIIIFIEGNRSAMS